jgi:hypothetical protein
MLMANGKNVSAKVYYVSLKDLNEKVAVYASLE